MRPRKATAALLLALFASLATPLAVRANPLLSGYGGPGEGSQAIIGFTLLGGSSGGGGAQASEQPQRSGSSGSFRLGESTSGSGGRTAGKPAGGNGGSKNGASNSGGQALAAGEAAGGRSRAGGSDSSGPAGGASLAGKRTGGAPYTNESSVTPAGGSGTLGLDGADALYGLLTLALLLGIAVLTRRLAGEGDGRRV